MSSINESQSDLQQLIGDDYRLSWVIGQGGMSTVWLADDLRNEREVAIKVLRPEFSDNNEFLSRFRNEALASEKIHSENVVRTYDYREVEHQGRTLCFIVMEYVRGESLADMLQRKGAFPEDQALDVLEQAAHGLSIIHRMGLVHRDIKPGNLLITQNGQVKITDFGIAKAADAVPLTRTGMVVGTAQYVSPEQAQGLAVTSSSDVYSLGVVGYEMLAGTRPFSGDSSVSVAIAHINQAPPALPTSISASARELIGIALRKDPEHRYADGNEFAHAISAARMGVRPPQPKAVPKTIAASPSPTAATHALGREAQPTTTHPATNVQPATSARPAPAAQPKKGSGLAWFLAVLLLLVLLAGGAFAYTRGLIGGVSTPTPPPPRETITATIIEEPEAPPEPETIHEEPTPESTHPTTSTTLPQEPEHPPSIEPSPLPGHDDPSTAETVELETPTHPLDSVIEDLLGTGGRGDS